MCECTSKVRRKTAHNEDDRNCRLRISFEKSKTLTSFSSKTQSMMKKQRRNNSIVCVHNILDKEKNFYPIFVS